MFESGKRNFGFICAALIVALMLSIGGNQAAAQSGGKIPWGPGTISIFNDGDIKDALKDILRSQQLLAIFKGGVVGSVDIDAENVPPAGLFNQLMSEHRLKYAFNAATKTVTISPLVSAAVKTGPVISQEFAQLTSIEWPVLKSTLEKFGLGSSGVIYDDRTGLVSIKGEKGRVTEIKKLIDDANKSETDRKERAIKIEREEKILEVQRERAKFEKEVYKDVQESTVKVIRLQYASVVTTTKTFQGQSVTVPGIEETLQSILGVRTEGVGGSATGSGAALPQIGENASEDEIAAQQTASALRLQDLRKPRVSVDARTNSVIVRGSPKAIAEVEAIIKDLDVKLRMVQIDMVVVTANKTLTEKLGVDLLGQATSGAGSNNPSSGFSTTPGASTGAVTDTALSILPAATDQVGGLFGAFVVGSASSFAQIKVAAFINDSKTQKLASPKIVTLDNVAGTIVSTNSITFTVSAADGSGSTQQTVEGGLSISALPSIIRASQGAAGVDDVIRLTFSAENTTPVLANSVVTTTGQEIATEVLIPDGATYILGGLFTDTRSEAVGGIPFLQDIPVLGSLFKTDTSSDAAEETIFFITPTIIDSDTLAARDIATRVGTREYMKRQRQRMGTMSATLEDANAKGYFPNAISSIVEDE